MKKRYSEEQIIGALKRQEAGATVSDLCRCNPPMFNGGFA